jgi:hypothetical protein
MPIAPTARLLGVAVGHSAAAAGSTLAAVVLAISALAPGFRPPVRFLLLSLAAGSAAVAVIQRESALERWQELRGWRSARVPYWLGQAYALHQGQQAYAQLVSPEPKTSFAEPIKPVPATDYGGTIDPVATPPIDWIEELLHYPSVLIWGAPGSGKSTAAESLIARRISAGHRVIIADVHREFGQWPDLQVVGDGKDFAAVEREFRSFLDEVDRRYQLRATQPDYKPAPLTLLVEEFTTMAQFVPSAAEFFACSVSDIRKVAMHVVYVSHARTMAGLGGSKGLAQTRDSSLMELELFAKPDPTTRQPVSTGMGRLKYPGGQAVEVSLPAPEKHRFPRFPEAEAESEALYRRYKTGGYRSQKAAIADLFNVWGGRRYAECAAKLERAIAKHSTTT